MMVVGLTDGVLLGMPTLSALSIVINYARGTVTKAGYGDLVASKEDRIRRVLVEGSTKLKARTMNIVLARVKVSVAEAQDTVCRVERRNMAYRGGLNVGRSMSAFCKDSDTDTMYTWVNMCNASTRDMVLTAGTHITDAEVVADVEVETKTVDSNGMVEANNKSSSTYENVSVHINAIIESTALQAARDRFEFDSPCADWWHVIQGEKDTWDADVDLAIAPNLAKAERRR